jgi:hypothetical protein
VSEHLPQGGRHPVGDVGLLGLEAEHHDPARVEQFVIAVVVCESSSPNAITSNVSAQVAK